MRKIISLVVLAACFASTATSKSEDKELIVISVQLDLDEPKTEVLIESADGKLKKLAPEKARAILKEEKHHVTDILVRDGKLVKITFKRKPIAPAKKS